MKKKKGPKAPNPLSVKKKKTVEPIQTQKAQNQYHEPQAGSKRKVDCLQEGANTSTAQDGETTSPKRKRKRRRKVTGDDSNPTTIL